MKIALIQSGLHWENPKFNRIDFQLKINELSSDVNLVILPEMFSTGFTVNAKQMAEPVNGETVLWMQELAKKQNVAIVGSLIIEEDNHFYNRLFFVFPSGELKSYDKRHLFSLAGEENYYTKGNQKLIIDYLGWKICPLICYDLRFPVFSRNTENYDLLIYVANWPKVRTMAWNTLLKARAIENMTYTIGVNRIGLDNNNYQYNGHSQVIDYLGNYVLNPRETEGVFVVNLDKNQQQKTRNKITFLNDKDNFIIQF